MRILGIETSCDETGAAIVEGNLGNKTVKLLSNVVASSLALHSKTGGIVPEIAAREQLKYIIPVIEEALRIRHSGKRSSALQNGAHPEFPTAIRDSGRVHYRSLARMTEETIDAVAVTIGPGLIGSLLVGVETAKTLAYVWNKPIIPVNHLIGHIYANFIKDEKPFTSVSLRAKRNNLNGIATSPLNKLGAARNDNINFPALSLIVSGGHTDLVLMENHQKIKWLGGTRDDAAGEAFDKIGRLLALPYPGGPSIEKAAQNGNPRAFNFPRPMIDSDDLDFSFSGLKTAVLRKVKQFYSSSERSESRSLSHKEFSTSSSNKIIADIAASVQQAIIDVLISKTLKAAQKYKVKSILLGGGVAANQKLRDQLKLAAKRYSRNALIFAPAKNLCTDNAAMIASAAFFNYKPVPWQQITANPELYFD